MSVQAPCTSLTHVRVRCSCETDGKQACRWHEFRLTLEVGEVVANGFWEDENLEGLSCVVRLQGDKSFVVTCNRVRL